MSRIVEGRRVRYRGRKITVGKVYNGSWSGEPYFIYYGTAVYEEDLG